jgi:hypothetical protein
MSDELPKCPDCGAPMSVDERRDIGREIRKEEVAMMYLNDPEGYAALPPVLGRPIGLWHKTETCSRCQYQAHDGQWTRRGKAD